MFDTSFENREKPQNRHYDHVIVILDVAPYSSDSHKHGVQRRMISVVNCFVFLRLLGFALLLLFLT